MRYDTSHWALILGIGWLGVIAWQAVIVLTGLLQHPASQRLLAILWRPWNLFVGLVALSAIAVGFIIYWRRWPRVLPLALGLPAVLVAAGLLVTSGQAVAFGTTLWLWLVAVALGLTLMRLVCPQLDPVATLIVASCLGLGFLPLLGLALGLAGLFERPAILAGSLVLAGGLAVWFRVALRHQLALLVTGRPWTFTITWPGAACLPPLAVTGLIVWIGVLTPETMFDALMYHLAMARTIATDGRVVGLDYAMYSYYPLGGELLFAFGYLLAGETAAKMLHLLAGLVTTGLVYLLGRAIVSSAAGLVAATIFATLPVAAWEATTTYVDLLMTMYTTGALTLLVFWRQGLTGPAGPALAGVSLGFALGVKLTAGFFALAIGLALLWHAWRNRAAGSAVLLPVTLTTLATVLTGGVWYLRAYLLTGNPIFPFLNSLFRSPLWPASDEWLSFATYGVGTSPAALLTLPWTLTFQTKLFGQPDGAAGVVLLAFAPLAWLSPRSTVRQLLGFVTLVSILFTLAWVVTSQQIRFLLPALAGLTVLAGAGAVGAGEQLGRQMRPLTWLPGTYLAVFMLLMAPVAAAPYLLSAERSPLAVVLGQVSRREYVQAVLPSAATFAYVNAQLDSSARIFPVAEAFQYLSDVPLVMPFSSAPGNRILFASSIPELRQELAQARITHILINRQRLPPEWNFPVHSPAFLDTAATLEYVANDVYLYRLR